MRMDRLRLLREVAVGEGTQILPFVNLYECQIGNDCLIGPFVEIQASVKVGDRVRIQSHSFICSEVSIEDDVFIGHGVVFTNDKYPKVGRRTEYLRTRIMRGASIGSNATILPVTVGRGAIIGAGSVVTKDVRPWAIVAGNPAKEIGRVSRTRSKQ